MDTRALKLTVSGRVQRVGFRRFVLDVAQEKGLAGYARNERDGSVTILVQGAEAEVKEFLAKARNPPPPALVKHVSEREVKAKRGLLAFTIKFGSVAEELQEGFGAIQTEFSDYRDEFKDYREEFRDYRKEFRGFANRTDESFGVLDRKYGEISAKLTSILEALERESVESRKELTRAVDNLSKLVERYAK
jgi:acylphosphatase